MRWPTCIAVGVPLSAYLVCTVSEPFVSTAICRPLREARCYGQTELRHHGARAKARAPRQRKKIGSFLVARVSECPLRRAYRHGSRGCRRSRRRCSCHALAVWWRCHSCSAPCGLTGGMMTGETVASEGRQKSCSRHPQPQPQPQPQPLPQPLPLPQPQGSLTPRLRPWPSCPASLSTAT